MIFLIVTSKEPIFDHIICDTLLVFLQKLEVKLQSQLDYEEIKTELR